MAKKKKPKKKLTAQELLRRAQARGLFLVASSWLLFFSLFSFDLLKPDANWLGSLGYVLAFGLQTLFGYASYLVPAYCLQWGIRLLRAQQLFSSFLDHSYFLSFLIASCFLITALGIDGGVPFYYLFTKLPSVNLRNLLGTTGTLLIFSSLAVVSILLLLRVPILLTVRLLIKNIMLTVERLMKPKVLKRERTGKEPAVYTGLTLPKLEPLSEKAEKKDTPILRARVAQLLDAAQSKVKNTAPSVKPSIPSVTPSLPAFNIKPVSRPDTPIRAYSLPSLELLIPPSQQTDPALVKRDLRRQSTILEETLQSFGIEAKVGEIHCGPTITSFEVHPSIGVKVQKIKALENDIALNMQAKSIRIVAPIPGKAAVGVEVPTMHPQEVNFRELLHYYQQQKQKKLHIPILLGKGVSGEPVFADLTKMPHLLIAGATGSGKSVCINSIVVSILMNARPDEIRLLMVDPKKVELTQYSKLPHMIAPVITEPHGAYAALQWLVKEMQLRYDILKYLGLRNISAFNARKIDKEKEASLPIPIPTHMPFIIAMIDEFADLMMVSSADIEAPIVRIAQMARAIGIHLILATQRPSREVITGIIKANIPCRIAFKVASRVNSQIILDEVGAEALLGNGDCLFVPPGSSQVSRAQGAFIRDEEIHRIIQAVEEQGGPNYLISSFDHYRSEGSNEMGESKGKDALYDQALEVIRYAKVASTTYLQRKLKIGYARAASLMDELEANHIIGPAEGSKPRRILLHDRQGDAEDTGERQESDQDDFVVEEES